MPSKCYTYAYKYLTYRTELVSKSSGIGVQLSMSYLKGLISLGRQGIKASNIYIKSVVGRILRCPLSSPFTVVCALYNPLLLSVDILM